MFVNPENKAFFQMTEKTYARWGKNKIKKLDFKIKAIKVIDLKAPYKGWKSGVTVII